MPWVPRGLREGIVTTRYPRAPDGYGKEFRASIDVTRLIDPAGGRRAQAACPTGAIWRDEDRLYVDRGRCILCGRCVQTAPSLFEFAPGIETAVADRRQLVVPIDDPADEDIDRIRASLHRRVKALRRSVHIRHVDAGSDGSEEWEIAALTNPIYDVQRLGVFFTASPRHADVLLVTGAGSVGMTGPLVTTYEAMPHPKVVVAVGIDAISGGMLVESYATRGGLRDSVPVDVLVPGSPPSPFSILHGILLALGLLPNGRTPSAGRSSLRPRTAPRPTSPDPNGEVGP
jgi:Ni,Fe-hydrogenase III small subunit/ferredoxin